MRPLYILPIILLSASLTVLGQHTPPRLIVRGDDMGFSHSGNEALIKCYREGIERSIEVIVPSPWFPEAQRLLAENLGVDVGIHLVLTSEWDNMKWRPLTQCPSLVDDDGYFYPMIWSNPNYPGRNLLAHKWKLDDIEKEWRAQIELAIKKIPRISHISGHMGCTNMNDSVSALAKRLATEYHLDWEREGSTIRYVNYDGPHGTAEEKVASFIKMLDGLSDDSTYIFVDHPALKTDELKAIYHKGYENVADDRQGVTDLFTDPRVMAAIKKKGIELRSYKDLAVPKP